MIRIATWSTPAGEFLTSSLKSSIGGVDIEIVAMDHRSSLIALESEKVDLALIPVLSVFQKIDELDILSDICLASTSSYPYAYLSGVSNLSSLDTIQFDPLYAQEVLMQKIVSKEHYGLNPSFIPVSDLNAADASLPLLKVNDASSVMLEDLDLGREWFECSAYPAIWGLFAAKKGRYIFEDLEPIKLAMLKANSDQFRSEWLESKSLSKPEEDFLLESIRTRIDMEVRAGLDSMQSFFFAHGIVDDLPIFPFLEKEEQDLRETDE